MANENWIDDSDISNTERFITWFGSDLRYVIGRGWHWWSGEIWQPEAESFAIECAKDTAILMLNGIHAIADEDAQKAAIKWAKQSQNLSRLKAMVSLAESDTRIRLPQAHFNRDPWMFNCANGTVNLKNGSITKHQRTDYCTRMAPAKYGEALPDDSLWLTFLRDITGGDKELEGYLKRVAGYCLTGSIAEKCFFFCYGGGDNGKSVFIEVLHALTGDYSLALSTETLVKKRYGNAGIPNDVARLNGPRLATVSETGKDQEWNDALIKDLTGGDIITARFLNQEFFDFRPQCKLMIRGNNKPEVTDNSSGMWKRIQLIPFEVQIAPDKQDKELREKIVRRELSGVLSWAVEGCLEWQQKGLAAPASITQAVESYRAEMDVFGEYVKERLEYSPDNPISENATNIYEDYKKWCEENGSEPCSQTKFGREMGNRGFKRVKNRGKINYPHLRLKPSSQPQDEGDNVSKNTTDDDDFFI